LLFALGCLIFSVAGDQHVAVLIGIDRYGGDLRLIVADQTGREGILHVALNGTAEISRAVFDREGLLGKRLHRLFGKAERDALFGKGFFEIAEHDLGDLHEILFVKRAEGDDLVDTV